MHLRNEVDEKEHRQKEPQLLMVSPVENTLKLKAS